MKRFSVFLLVLSAVMLFFSYVSASAVSDKTALENKQTNYAAFGDSIAYGFGLSDIKNQCYVNIVSDKLNAVNDNYSVNGMTSTGLLNALNAINKDTDTYNYIKNSALITVSIGSNDLLGKLTSILNGVLAANNGKLEESSYAMIEASLVSADSSASFESGVSTYKENLPLIYAKIREINPNAQIIMTQFYNPYYGVMLGKFDFSALCDSYITKMNDVLAAGTEEMNYTIAEIYEPFNKTGLTCVNMLAAPPSFDPHPNAAGHSVIADSVLDAVSDDIKAFAVLEETESAEEKNNSNETVSLSENSESTNEEDTSDAEGNGQEKGFFEKYGGSVILAVLALGVFGITGVVMSSRNKKENEKRKKQ